MLEHMLANDMGKRNVKFSITGPGPDVILAGDNDSGYFGRLSSTEIITGDSLADALGITSGIAQNSDTDWMKFYLDGKVLFIPVLPIRYGVSWYSLYLLGAVYGDGLNIMPHIGTSVEQDAVVKAKGYNFRVRLMKGSLLDPYQGRLGTTNTEDVYTVGSEWDKLMHSVTSASTPNLGHEKWDSLSLADLGLSTGSGRYTLCQETISANSARRLARGYYGIFNSHYTVFNEASNNLGYRPVLELLVNDIAKPMSFAG